MQIEKWYIKRTKENSEDVNKWFNSICKIRDVIFFESSGIVNFPAREQEKNNGHHANEIHMKNEGYVEIDTEYFRQHILQIPSEDSKEIINNSYSIF